MYAIAPGAGPQHFKFGTDGRHAYTINEMGDTIVAYDYTAATGVHTAPDRAHIVRRL